jgi:carboxylesterase type B
MRISMVSSTSHIVEEEGADKWTGSDLAKLGNMIVVSINYRVGPYGFLLNNEVLQGGGSSNNGIRDQIKALEWTKKHISKVSHPR